MICDDPWDYESVRHVGCCPSCGGALLCAGPDATPAVTTGRDAEVPLMAHSERNRHTARGISDSSRDSL